MKLKNKKSGFTLLEIIIVIIIVGVLASLALPRFFSTIEFSRSTEALATLGTIRKSIERCSLVKDDVTGCGDTDFTELDMEDPGAEAGAHFAYTIVIDNGPNKAYTITATRNTIDGGTAGDTVVLQVDPAAAAGLQILRSGTGAFVSIK